jgi:hypothetical protein
MKSDDERQIDREEFPEIQEDSERNLAMLRDYLKRIPVVEIAERHGVGTATVYRAIKKGKWSNVRKRMSQRHYKEAVHEVARDLDKQRELEKAIAAKNIKQAADGRYFTQVEIRVPEGASPWGPIPADPRCERKTVDGRHYIRTYLTEADLAEIKALASR